METGNRHGSTARRLPRKPAGRVRLIHCYCSHGQAEHHGGACSECECDTFRPRPCVCGHAAAVHTGRCQHCDCRSFREDGSPSFLLERGIRAGEWQFITVPQLRWLMRPDQNSTVRVWACLMLHCQRGKTNHDRRRLAVKMDTSGRWVPLLPSDILEELNALDGFPPRLDRHVIRKQLRELQRMGVLRRHGRFRKNVMLFLYLRPLSEKAVEPDLGVNPDPQIPQVPNKSVACGHISFSHIRGAVVKAFNKCLRMDLDATGHLGVSPDLQKQVDQIIEEAVLGVQAAYEKALLGVCPAALYKEDSMSSSKGDPVPASSSNTPPIVENTPEPEPETTTTAEKDPVLEALSTYGPAEQEAAESLAMECRAAVPDTTPEEIAIFVHMKGRQIIRNPYVRNPIGVLIRKVPALLRTHLPAHRAAVEAERRKTELLRERNRREWESWLADPDTSEDDKAFACRMLQENAPDLVPDAPAGLGEGLARGSET